MVNGDEKQRFSRLKSIFCPMIFRKNMEESQKHCARGEIDKAPKTSSIGLIIRQKEPNNLETPFDQI